MLTEKSDMYYTAKTIFNSKTKAWNENSGGTRPLQAFRFLKKFINFYLNIKCVHIYNSIFGKDE